MALVNSAVIPCPNGLGLTIAIHDDNTYKFTDPETGVAKSFTSLDVAKTSLFFRTLALTGIPRLSGITFT